MNKQQKHFIYDDLSDFFNQRYTRGEEVLAEKKLFALDMLRKTCPPEINGPKTKVLDLGCGTGRITVMLKDAGYDVIGADISDVAIKALEERGIDGFIHDINNRLPVEDEIYDVVWTTDLFELVPDMFLFLSEMHRTIKPGGYLLFTMPNMSWWYFRIKYLLGKTSSDLMPPSQCRFWSRHTIDYFLNNDYFKPVALAGVAPIPGPSGIKRVRTKRFGNILARDIVGICQRL